MLTEVLIFFFRLQVSDTLVVSGCEGGKVKVWDIEQTSLLKVTGIRHRVVRLTSWALSAVKSFTGKKSELMTRDY